MLSPHRNGQALRPSPPRTSVDQTEDDNGESSPLTVLPSSTELFYFYAQTLDQCASLSTGQPLFDLANLHRKWLRIYADEVLTMGSKR